MRLAGMPAAASRATAASTGRRSGPEITVWVGRVVVGDDHARRRRRSSALDLGRGGRPPRPSRPGRRRPRRGWPRPGPRSGASRSSAVVRRRPRTARPARRSCGRRPGRGARPARLSSSCTARPAMPRVGWAEPGVGDRRLLGRLVARRVKAAGGNMRRRVPAAGQPQQPLQPGEGHEQVGEHPRPLAALAGEEEGDLARPPASAAAVAGREHAVAGVARRPPAARACAARSSRSSATTARPRCTGPPPGGRRRVGGGAGRAARQGRPAPSFGRRPARPDRSDVGRRRGRGTARPATRRRPCAGSARPVVAGQHGVEVGAAEAEGADPGVPLGGRRRPRAGAVREGERAGRRRPSRGWARCRCSVGGRTPVCSAQRRLDQPGQARRRTWCGRSATSPSRAQPAGLGARPR